MSECDVRSALICYLVDPVGSSQTISRDTSYKIVGPSSLRH